MRLVCPNCAAQYEVDASAIPDEGRDVQCANCGNTWFQPPERVEPEETVEPDTDAPEPEEDAPLARPPATPVDQSVLDILRQEAELDANTRQAEPTPDEETPVEPEAEAEEVEPESDPSPEVEPAELTLAERAAQNRLSARKERSARISLSPPSAPEDLEHSPERQAEYAEVEPEPEYTPAPRRDPATERPERDLPDVDALNSTLRPANDKGRARDEKRGRKQKKQGSRRNNLGFYVAVLIFLVLLAAYALRPQIMEALPASEPYLTQYALFVDTVRVKVADGMLALIETVKNLIARFV